MFAPAWAGLRSRAAEAQRALVRSKCLSTNPMCSSSGTPSSSAPLDHVLPAHPRANALSLSFFFTLETSRSCRLREGRTRAQATRKPAQLVNREEGAGHGRIAGHAGVVRVSQDGPLHRLGKALRREDPHAFCRVFLGGGMGALGKRS